MAEKESHQNDQQPQTERRKPIALIVIVIILIGLLGFVSWLYLDQKQTTQEITTALNAEKDSLRSNLEELKSEYDSLRTNNDSLNAKLDIEQEKIDGLLSELKNVKATNYTKIKQLKDELGTLRKVAKSYVRQIDSLNRVNQQLQAENVQVKRDLKETQESKKELEEEKKDLTKKVQKASILRTENVSAIAINEKGKEKTKVDKIDKIKVCFTIEDNVLIEPGDKTFYLRIAAPPEDFILTNSEKNLFEFEGKQIVYSAKRTTEYDGTQQDMCIYFDSKGELKPGEYDIYIFADGHEVGKTILKLEESGWLFF